MTDDLERPPVDFIVTREDWCRYDLSDNVILKVKVVLTRVFKQQGQLYCDFQPIYVILTNERGNPDSNTKSVEELQSLAKEDVRFTAVSQDWNEYVVDDGTTIRIQPIVTKVVKTSKFDRNGFPVYLCNIQGNMTMNPTTAS
jgi:hypothetical protein